MEDVIKLTQLKDDLSTVMRDAEALIHASADHGGAKMAEARARIHESLEAAKARFRAAEQAARRQASDTVHATGDFARRNPWQAMGIAAGVGLVIGVLLGRR
jgi:ElaB/YqjD/DUF883 family membrane-anchored ribosome-binding protein